MSLAPLQPYESLDPPRRRIQAVLLAGAVALFLGSTVANAGGHVLTHYALLGAGALGFALAVVAGGAEASSMLKLYTAVLLLLPPDRGVGGSGITAATLLAIACAWLWVHGMVVPSLGLSTTLHPFHWALVALSMAVGASLVVAATRPWDALESSSMTLGTVNLLSSLAAGLLVADGLRTRSQLEAMVRGLVVLGSIVAFVGVVQFVFEFDLSAYVRFAGLASVDGASSGILAREGFSRVIGTTLHPIEFSVVLTMILPLALHLTFRAEPGRRGRWWVAVALIAAATPMSVSRSGALGLFFVGLVLFPSWTGARRAQALVASGVFLVGMKFLVPGLLGTIKALFLSAGVDPSVTGRTIDYSYASGFIAERPWFGRGFATFSPTRYDYLDNQYLVTLIEMGVVGLLAVVALFVTAIAMARITRSRSTDEATKDLAQSLVASLVVVLVSFATFDFLGFPTARGLAFVLLGVVAAFWRLEATSGMAAVQR